MTPAVVASHYINTPMRNMTILHGAKNGIFLANNGGIFLKMAQNTDCGYSLESHLKEAVLTISKNLRS